MTFVCNCLGNVMIKNKIPIGSICDSERDSCY